MANAASPVSDRAAVKVRRVTINGSSGQIDQLFKQRVDLLVEFLERGLALDLLAIDEEGRRRIHLQHLAGVFLVGGDLVEQRLVLQAILDLLLAEARLLADPVSVSVVFFITQSVC